MTISFKYLLLPGEAVAVAGDGIGGGVTTVGTDGREGAVAADGTGGGVIVVGIVIVVSLETRGRILALVADDCTELMLSKNTPTKAAS